jgi:hypothetical protein
VVDVQCQREAPERMVLLAAGAKHVPRHECMDWRWLIVIRGMCVCQNNFVPLSNFTRHVHHIQTIEKGIPSRRKYIHRLIFKMVAFRTVLHRF